MNSIQILYGVKLLSPVEYTLRRIKARWWWQKDQGELSSEFVIITGDYDIIAENALIAGMMFKVID